VDRAHDIDWSFELLADQSSNDRLQKIYDFYQFALNPPKAFGQKNPGGLPLLAGHQPKPQSAQPPGSYTHTNTNTNTKMKMKMNTKMRTATETETDIETAIGTGFSHAGPKGRPSHSRGPGAGLRQESEPRETPGPRPPQAPRTNAHIFDHAQRANPYGNFSAHKSSSPYASKLTSELRPSTRSKLRKKSLSKEMHPTATLSQRKVSTRNSKRADVPASHRAQGVGPITIIQAPLINTYHNYNSFHIGNISISDKSAPSMPAYPATAAKPPTGARPLAEPAIISNYRLRKYRPGNNLSFVQ
jgi:hypothetical protein